MLIDDVIARISEQQKGYEDTTVEMCGEQLKDICRESEANAELVLADLDSTEMSIVKCEQKIRAYADELHRKIKSKSVGVSTKAADKIIREFYGLGAKQAERKTISLDDYA